MWTGLGPPTGGGWHFGPLPSRPPLFVRGIVIAESYSTNLSSMVMASILIQWCYQFTHKRIPIGHVFLSIIFLHRSRKCSLNASGDKKALDYPPNHYQQRILPVIIQKGPLAENKLPGESHTWDSRIAHHRPIQIFTRPA